MMAKKGKPRQPAEWHPECKILNPDDPNYQADVEKYRLEGFKMLRPTKLDKSTNRRQMVKNWDRKSTPKAILRTVRYLREHPEEKL